MGLKLVKYEIYSQFWCAHIFLLSKWRNHVTQVCASWLQADGEESQVRRVDSAEITVRQEFSHRRTFQQCSVEVCLAAWVQRCAGTKGSDGHRHQSRDEHRHWDHHHNSKWRGVQKGHSARRRESRERSLPVSITARTSSRYESQRSADPTDLPWYDGLPGWAQQSRDRHSEWGSTVHPVTPRVPARGFPRPVLNPSTLLILRICPEMMGCRDRHSSHGPGIVSGVLWSIRQLRLCPGTGFPRSVLNLPAAMTADPVRYQRVPKVSNVYRPSTIGWSSRCRPITGGWPSSGCRTSRGGWSVQSRPVPAVNAVPVLLQNLGVQPQVLSIVRRAPFEGSNVLGSDT